MTTRAVIFIAAIVMVVILCIILEKKGITAFTRKGRPSGIIGAGFQGLQNAIDPNANKAHEYIVEKREEKEKFDVKSGEGVDEDEAKADKDEDR